MYSLRNKNSCLLIIVNTPLYLVLRLNEMRFDMQKGRIVHIRYEQRLLSACASWQSHQSIPLLLVQTMTDCKKSTRS